MPSSSRSLGNALLWTRVPLTSQEGENWSELHAEKGIADHARGSLGSLGKVLSIWTPRQ